MRSIRTLALACVALAIVGSAFAQLSAANRDWANGPVKFIMTPEEQAKWNLVKTDADAQAFIDLFWARRDPTPGTAPNEFRDRFEKLVAVADQNLAEGKTRGSLTERGRVMVILGTPTAPVKLIKPAAQRGTGLNNETQQADNAPFQARQEWPYEAAKMNNLIANDITIGFVDRLGGGVYKMEHDRDVVPVLQAALQKFIVSPNLTEAPKPQAAAPAQKLPTPTPAATAAAVGAFKTESLKTAVEQFTAAATNPYKSAAVTYTEMLTPMGDYFVPVQLYIPQSAGLSADQVTTFFGRIQDEAKNTVAVFEEPATLSTSKGDLYFDRSLNLKPGKYTATLGLSNATGTPVVMVSSPMDLTALSKDQAGITDLVLASDVHELETAAVAGAPYALGRLKIVPKGDATFSNRDEITYFVEVINPGIDEATKLPKLQVKLDLIGAGEKNKPGRTISAPITDASALPLSGIPGPGQYAILASIPLGEMKNPLPAGDYTLRVKVYDQVAKQSWTTERKFVMTAAPGTEPPPAPAAPAKPAPGKKKGS